MAATQAIFQHRTIFEKCAKSVITFFETVDCVSNRINEWNQLPKRKNFDFIFICWSYSSNKVKHVDFYCDPQRCVIWRDVKNVMVADVPTFQRYIIEWFCSNKFQSLLYLNETGKIFYKLSRKMLNTMVANGLGHYCWARPARSILSI